MRKGLEFRGNYTWAKNLDINSGLTGAQANNQAQMVLDRKDLRDDWGPSALNPTSQASLSARLRTPLRRRPALVERCPPEWKANSFRLATQRHRNSPVRISVHTSGGIEPIGRRRHTESGPADPSTPLSAVRSHRKPQPMVQSERVGAGGGDLRKYSPEGRDLLGPGLADLDVSLFKNTSNHGKHQSAIPSRVFQRVEPVQLWSPERECFFKGTAISPSAGVITTTATSAREIQLGLKFIF